MQSAYLDDPVKNLQALVSIIIANVQNIQKNVNTLKKCHESFQKNVISIPFNNSVEIQDEINKQIKSTTFIFKKVAQPYLKFEKLDRIRLEKIRNEFHDLVKEYGRLQAAITTASKNVGGEDRKTNLEANERTPLLRANKHDFGNNSSSGNPFEESLTLEREQQKLKEREVARAANLDFERGLAVERLCKVEDLEAIILDVNQIFKDLGYMVREQGETLDTVESHLETANSEVENANLELHAASHTYNSKYKRKVCVLVIILLIILAIIVTIVAMKFKTLPRLYY